MNAANKTSSPSLTSRLGGWAPLDPNELNRWLKHTIQEAEEKVKPFHPVIDEFREMIETDPVLYMYFTQMFEQQPVFPPPPGSGDVKLKDYRQMLKVLNYILTTAPAYDDTGLVGFPINAILDFPMITPAGLAAFATEKVNDMLRKVLAVWTRYLDSENSCYVLNESPTGWLSPSAWKALSLDDFAIDRKKPFLGFKSWNDFFIREFRDIKRQRPVASPNDNSVIVSACESSPYAIQNNVKEHDTFWLKGQPYSLRHLLNEQFVDEFVGGTVYQAFLSAKKYHRWHSPVSGTIKHLEKIPGTYYSEAASQGFDPAGPNDSQGYIAHVATRALIFIEADNQDIGLLCMIPIGMAEVSSCMLIGADGEPLKKDQHVKKGEQIGYFQFGGSSYCLVFGKDVISAFALNAIPQGENGMNSANVEVNSFLAKSR